MIIDYMVTQTTALDPFHIRVVVDIRTPYVVNGYGGGAITLTVPLDGYRDAIETAVMKKFGREVHPQSHELALNGDCTKVEQMQEELELFAAQRREQSRAIEPLAQEDRTTEGEQEQSPRVEEPPIQDPGDEAVQEAAPSVDEAGQADVPSALEESPKE